MMKSVVAALSLAVSSPVFSATPVSSEHFTILPRKTAASLEELKNKADEVTRRLQTTDKTVKLTQIYTSSKTGDVAFATFTGEGGKAQFAIVFLYRDGSWNLIPDLLYVN